MEAATGRRLDNILPGDGHEIQAESGDSVGFFNTMKAVKFKVLPPLNLLNEQYIKEVDKSVSISRSAYKAIIHAAGRMFLMLKANNEIPVADLFAITAL